jgi:hypothetical protein
MSIRQFFREYYPDRALDYNESYYYCSLFLASEGLTAKNFVAVILTVGYEDVDYCNSMYIGHLEDGYIENILSLISVIYSLQSYHYERRKHNQE